MLQRQWLILTPILIAAVPVVLMLSFMFRFGYGAADAWEATMRLPVAKTEYAKRFTEEGLLKIREDLDDRTVVEVLGIPLRKENRSTLWHYSLPREESEWYHARDIRFERDKLGILRVKAVDSTFRQIQDSD